VLDVLARTLSEDGVVALAHVLEGTSDDVPLTPAEVDAVSVAARKSSWHETERALYTELRDLARDVDPIHAELLAFSAYLRISPVTGALLTLSKRAAATVDPQLRARLAVSLEAAGNGVAAGGAMLDRFLGTSLKADAAKLRGDLARARDLITSGERWLTELKESGDRAQWGLWPLPSVRREWSPETEAPTLERLVK
jgi:hypothetical protein